MRSREDTINMAKGEIIKRVIKPPQSHIPFSVTTNSSAGEWGTSGREGCNVHACKTCNETFTSFHCKTKEKEMWNGSFMNTFQRYKPHDLKLLKFYVKCWC